MPKHGIQHFYFYLLKNGRHTFFLEYQAFCYYRIDKIVFFFQESRRLKFWYVDGTDYLEQVTTAYEFFKELVRPQNFPRGLYRQF